GLMVSGAGCIANDLWDRRIDRQVERTRQRPLAKGSIRISTAVGLLLLLLLLSLLVVVSLPTASRGLCLGLAVLALPPILLYPSAKRWFAYPQAVLALCWGFAVLIPWAASQANLSGGWPLIGCWLATLMWTFGFDTVYAMADRRDDANLALKSSALSLGSNALKTVALSYALACTVLATAAVSAGVSWTFWPFWLIASIGMQKETWALRGSNQPMTTYGQHFQHQVLLGAMLLIGLILGRIS
ncbi:MAG TPA: 4-hydroxybenzoate polyprenyltransferase, partial [Prochlorococcus sp.]